MSTSAGELSKFILLKLRKTHSRHILYKLFVPKKALSEGLSLCCVCLKLVVAFG